MKYVVNTVWNHPNDIDWDAMKEGLEQLRNDEGAAEEVTWYEIDATTPVSYTHLTLPTT